MNNSKRWFQVVIGVLILLFAGVVYAWSVMSQPIAKEYADWTGAQLSLTFTLVMITFCLGCLIAGIINKKFKPIVFCWAAGVLYVLGFFLASRATTPVMLYLGFGVLCGFGSGLVYSAALSTVGKWFPDKQGLISGILLMGFGISAFIAGKVYQATLVNWRTSFLVMGIIGAVDVVVCGLFLKGPDASFVPPAAASAKKKAVNPVARESAPMETLKNPVFWLYYIWAILLSAAGLTVVSQAAGIVREVGPAIAAGSVATIVGLLSVFNGIGRIIYGGNYDRSGRAVTMTLVCLNFILAAVILIFAVKLSSVVLIVVGFIMGGFAYGGVTPTNSAFTSSYFGLKNYPTNFSFTNTNLIVASFGSTIAGALYDATHSFMSAFFLMIGLAAAGILVSLLISAQDKRVLAKMGK